MGRLLNRSANGDFYASEVAAAVRTFRLLDPDYAIANDPAWYEKAMRDPIISMTVSQRSNNVSGNEWFFQAASDSPLYRKAAEVMTSIFKNLGRFREARSLLAKAFLKGSTWAKKLMEWITVNVDEEPIKFWAIKKLQDAEKRRFRRIRTQAEMPDSGELINTFFWEVHNPDKSRWEPLDRSDWVRHIYTNEEIGLGFGRGISAPLYFLQWWKAEAFTHGMAFLSRWSQGMVIGSLDAIAEGVFGDEGSAEERGENFLLALEKMRTRHFMVVPRGDEIKIHDAPSGAWQTVQSAIDYADRTIRALVLGAVLPTGGGSDVGSLARAEVESGVSDEVIQYDRGLEEETIQVEMVEPTWNDNRTTMGLIGLDGAQCPIFRISKSRKSDPDTRGRALDTALTHGMTVKRDEAYRDLGWTDPGPDAKDTDVLSPISAGSDLYTDPNLFGIEKSFEEQPPDERGIEAIKAMRKLCDRLIYNHNNKGTKGNARTTQRVHRTRKTANQELVQSR